MKPSKDQNGIALGLNELERRLYHALLQQCDAEYRQWLRNQLPGRQTTPEATWIEFLKFQMSQEMSALENLRRVYGRFVRALKTSPRPEDQKQLILNFARDLGASPADLEKDAAAFARWFGADAVTDRYNRLHARHEQYMAFLLDRLAAAAAGVARGIRDSNEQLNFWKQLKLETVVKPLLVHDGDVRLKLAAFRCFAGVLSALAREIQELAVDDTTLQYIYRSALQHQQDVWIQCTALELLVTLSWESFERALKNRLLQPARGDDLFVRRRAVQLLERHFHRVDRADEVIAAVLSDPGAFVRQALPKVLLQAPPAVAVPALERLIAKDASPQVRATTWLEWPGLLTEPHFRDHALRLYREVAPQEKDEFVLRVICLVTERSTEELRRRQDAFLGQWQPAARELLLHIRCHAATAKVRRWASQSFEFVWSECLPEARILRDRFVAFARTIPRGGNRRLPAALTEGLDPAFLGRIWSIVCRRDYDAQLQQTRRGYKVFRGHVFGFRWWRWWHEFRHPSPDKRQAFSHTIGRLFDGDIHVPSAIMAELAQTKVPGEPLHISAEGGWRPFLPLPDELTSGIEFGRKPQPFRIFTSEGVTHIVPPRGRQRWRAAVRLTWHFRHYAEKRNWLDSMQEPASSYVEALRELGFEIRFETHLDDTGKPLPADPMVMRFFTEVAAAEPEPTVVPAAKPVAERPALVPATPLIKPEPVPEPVAVEAMTETATTITPEPSTPESVPPPVPDAEVPSRTLISDS